MGSRKVYLPVIMLAWPFFRLRFVWLLCSSFSCQRFISSFFSLAWLSYGWWIWQVKEFMEQYMHVWINDILNTCFKYAGREWVCVPTIMINSYNENTLVTILKYVIMLKVVILMMVVMLMLLINIFYYACETLLGWYDTYDAYNIKLRFSNIYSCILKSSMRDDHDAIMP